MEIINKRIAWRIQASKQNEIVKTTTVRWIKFKFNELTLTDTFYVLVFTVLNCFFIRHLVPVDTGPYFVTSKT